MLVFKTQGLIFRNLFHPSFTTRKIGKKFDFSEIDVYCSLKIRDPLSYPDDTDSLFVVIHSGLKKVYYKCSVQGQTQTFSFWKSFLLSSIISREI